MLLISRLQLHPLKQIKVVPIPVLQDNYAYLLIDSKTRKAAAIDPVEPAKVAAQIKENSVKLDFILTTHHHNDHAGGNEEMSKLFPGIRIYGHDNRIPALTHTLDDNQTLKLGDLEITTIIGRCHTTGHLSYYVSASAGDFSEHVIFTGDNLFVAGCGRFFEGQPIDMVESLRNHGKLPADTHVYCGHEYTRNNLRFATSTFPQNKDMKEAYETTLKMKCTIPSTIEQEKLINPFMRTSTDEIMNAMGTTSEIEAMAKLRKMKDSFK